MPLRISFKTSPQRVDWATLDATWALAGELGGFDGAWMNDHLTDMDPDAPGPSLEALDAAGDAGPPRARASGSATRCCRTRSATRCCSRRRRPSWTTRPAARFVLGLGAGWFEGEHEPFGIPLPPIGERIDRLISAVEVLQALFSPEAAAAPGVTRADPFYPLSGAVNAPAPLTPGGPPIFLGGQKPRGIALAARRAAGWLLTGTEAGDVAYFADRREAILRALEAGGAGPGDVRDRRAGPHGRGRGVPGAGARRRRGRWSRPGRRRWSSACRRRWGPGRWRTRIGTCCVPLRAEHG